jgi:hypothetical protein
VGIACAAKLFTVGCGERFQRLSSPPVNNFGEATRVGVRGKRACDGIDTQELKPQQMLGKSNH